VFASLNLAVVQEAENMPKDPKRNIQSYQIEGGHLNEFEYQQKQGELAEGSGFAFSEDTNKPNPTEAMERITQVTADAHRKVEKRKRGGLVPVANRKNNASSKRPAKKVARKPAKKKTTRKKATRATTKKRASTGGKTSAQKTAKKSARKGTKTAASKKRS
jgi:hypothetical protein